MSESGGAKFLRLLEALIAQTREGAISWHRVSAQAAHERAHPADEFGEVEFEESYITEGGTERTGPVAILFQPHDNFGQQPATLIVCAPSGKFRLVETQHTADLFADLCFLVTGGGDRRAALDAALEAIAP